MQLIVLGMHRSGTSTVTRLLNLAGAHFGPDDIATEANDENPKGFWERRDVRAVCDGLLQGVGLDWWRVADLDLSTIPQEVVDEQLAAWRTIVAELDEHKPWVVKEPRLCLLLPLLLPALDSPVCVHVTRDPLEVAQSVQARSGYPVRAGLALWEVYTRHAVGAAAGLPRLHLPYQDVQADPVGTTADLVSRLGDLGVTGLHVPDATEITDFISPSLHRQRPRSSRSDQLTATQAEMASAIDEGRLFELDPDAPISAGADEALRVLADDQDRRAHVASLEAAARLQRLRNEDLTRRLDTRERTYQDLRQRSARPLWMIAGTRAKRGVATVRNAGRPTDALGAGGGPTGLARVVASAERVAKRVLPDRDGGLVAAEGPAPVIRTRPARPSTGRPSAAVISWDVGHNPLGRAHVLAEILGRTHDVELWGAQFPRYGDEVWAPLRDSEIPINLFEGRPFPSHMATMEDVARQIEADVIWVSKPRVPSYLLGALAKEARSRALVLDVDDRELSFFGEEGGVDSRYLLDRKGSPDLGLPFERAWTRACDPAITAADAVTVSNPALQHLYGGTIVPHARDERVFDPTLYDRDEVRHSLGLRPDQRVVLFGGTPRVHKGVLEVLRAIDRLGDDRYRLLVFGSRQLDEMRAQIGDLSRWVQALPEQPFSALARTVAAADVSCVLQDPTHPVSAYQLPAKITDALAMQVPCLVTATPPLEGLIGRDVLQVVDPGDELHERLARVFDDPDEARDRARRGRELFRAELSHEAVSRVVAPLFGALADDPPPLAPRLAELVDVTRRITLGAVRATPTPDLSTDPSPGRAARRPGQAAHPVVPGEPFDVVVFWKQNDTGLYGRRQDMFVKYLQRTGRVRRVVHFDNPIAPETMAKLYLRSAGSTTDQSRLILRRTLARIAHRADTDGVRHRTFVHGGEASRLLGLRGRSRYVDHVRSVLEGEGVGQGAHPMVLWAFPSNDDLPDLIDALEPDMVVTDVVDDNRTWSRPGSATYKRIERNYTDVLSRSDVVIANCEPVAERMRLLAPEVHLVPNGLEMPGDLPTGPCPPDLAELGRPIIGYVGNLSSRIDISLLEAIARARPQWQIVLIGSTHLDRSILRLEGFPNVHFLGVKPYDEALLHIRHFDVALIPHIDNEMTRAMNPLKAFVYSAAGVPVVSTPIANLGAMASVIKVAEGRDGFVAAIEDALAEGPVDIDGDLLKDNSWETRVAHVMELIDRAASEMAS